MKTQFGLIAFFSENETHRVTFIAISQPSKLGFNENEIVNICQ